MLCTQNLLWSSSQWNWAPLKISPMHRLRHLDLVSQVHESSPNLFSHNPMTLGNGRRGLTCGLKLCPRIGAMCQQKKKVACIYNPFQNQWGWDGQKESGIQNRSGNLTLFRNPSCCAQHHTTQCPRGQTKLSGQRRIVEHLPKKAASGAELRGRASEPEAYENHVKGGEWALLNS